MLELNRLYHMDCMEGMREFPDKFFDLAIVDPPYFAGPNTRKYYGSEVSTTGVERVEYPVIDTWDIPDQAYFDELRRVSKHQIVWGCNYFDCYLGPGRIVWDKCNGATTFSDAEIAYCSIHDSTRLFAYMWSGMMQGKSITEGRVAQGNKIKNEKRIHPCQKPIVLYRWILQTYAKPGNIIIDTHAGSASSLIACHDMGYRFVGLEKNLKVWKSATDRLEAVRAQQRLEGAI